MVVFVCLYDTNLLVCGGECSCPHSGLLANPMRERVLGVPVATKEYCVSILFIRFLCKHQQGRGAH